MKFSIFHSFKNKIQHTQRAAQLNYLKTNLKFKLTSEIPKTRAGMDGWEQRGKSNDSFCSIASHIVIVVIVVAVGIVIVIFG